MKLLKKQSSQLIVSTAIAAIFLVGCGSLGFGKSSSKKQAAARKAATANAPNMGVNSYLWRASLETLNFMPLAQVDPFGGVIVTDWYASAEAPNERFKANVYILDTNLRADALKASIFKQKRISGSWQDASIDADTARQIENAILTRARELYIATVDAQ
ncbi:DUF3576 domain-containing protein [Hellea sp.]|jgi:hypothetical protein|nr:DUF3576 domain-containing protein [Hellea sp.]MDA9931794.1 DUF3576 domain-containing protein [bacterium]MDA8887582.1 DUF3576 domain-containing protein [Hellea sp.]MDB4844248.1 DUF3576 domain-containing protein [Hellea sp.]MDC0421648.1 DUF3576 domain-containing protein [Hellea sp.]MDC0651326.1 DUF3576 domain-containing protein [Hellea sp.]